MEEIEAKNPRSTTKHRMPAKLIFNPGAGVTGDSPVQLMDVISEMQAWKLVPEAYLVEPDSDLTAVVQKALEDGMRMFVVCGGDGTIDVMAGALAGTNATLGIIPTGTQNNVALSLGILAVLTAVWGHYQAQPLPQLRQSRHASIAANSSSLICFFNEAINNSTVVKFSILQ